MPALSKIQADLKESLKSKNAARAGVLRLLLSSLHNRVIEKRAESGTEELTDDEVQKVLASEAKKRKEAAELMRKGGREDLAAKEDGELKIINEYLPPELSREEITAIVRQLKGKGLADFNSLVKEAMKEIKGRADGKTVTEIIKEELK